MPHREVGADPDGSTDRLLGELIAEIRAVKHNQNNASQKLDAVNTVAGALKDVLRRLEKTEREQETHHLRLAVLEADKHRREGAIGLVEWLSRHWPFTLIALGITAFVAWANGMAGK